MANRFMQNPPNRRFPIPVTSAMADQMRREVIELSEKHRVPIALDRYEDGSFDFQNVAFRIDEESDMTREELSILGVAISKIAAIRSADKTGRGESMRGLIDGAEGVVDLPGGKGAILGVIDAIVSRKKAMQDKGN